ncbi:MAG TPA: magnesium/cobalt transporter CorA [Thermomicrobiales bacterium]|nr:magnesium/cobalt transporter CorA [Thermomicrobiales bacterium]
MIKVKVHAEGAVLDQDLPLDRISDTLQSDNSLLWVDVIAPNAKDIELLEQEFGFHHLALEDAALVHERPKIDLYDDFLLIIFYALTHERRETPGLRLEQLSLFAGKNFVVTLHQAELPVLDQTSDRWCASHAKIKNGAAGLLVYSILDALVDEYLPIADRISDRIDVIEDAVFGRFDANAQQEIFRIKRNLLQMRKVLTPERDVLNVLMRRDTPIFSDETVRYFQDIYDHLLRVLDSIDTYRDLLSSALDSYLSVQSNRMNKVMKTLTASSIILMTVTLVASIYGMNFVHMPELKWHYGYALALGLMVTIAATLGALFRKIDWF